MNKKAQNIGQVFLYVLTLVIIGMVLLFGYQAISDLIGKTEQVSLAILEKEMSDTVKSLSSDFGSVSIKSFDASGYQQMCIVTSFEPVASIPPGIASQYPLIADSVADNAQQNIFLISSGQLEKPFFVDDIEVPLGAACYPIVSGTIELRMEGRGDRVVVTSP